MKKPWFRGQNKAWYVKFNGRQKLLGHDDHGATRKNPPPEVVEAWHRLERIGEHKDVLYPDIADLYVKSLKNPKTAKDTKWQLDGFVKFIGKVKVSKLRVHHISDYLKTKTTWNSSSQADCIERITSSLSFAIKEGYIDDHKVKYQRGQKPRRKRRVIIIEDKHADAIEAAVNPNMRAILRGLRLSGARPKELCTARIEHCDLKNGIMLVLNKTRETTDLEYRPLYLSSAMVELVRKAIGTRKQGNVFLTTRGGAYTPQELSHQVRLVRIKLKLPKGITPYGARHSFASNAINKKKLNPAHVAKLLGHVGLDQLKIYYHPDHDVLREEIEKTGD